MCCDLTKEMCEEFGILAVPMSYTMDGRDFLHTLEDGNPHEFYQALRNGSISKTSQINSEDFIEFFTPFLEQGEDILYLAFSSGDVYKRQLLECRAFAFLKYWRNNYV